VLCIAVVFNAFTNSVYPRLCALCSYLCVCVSLCECYSSLVAATLVSLPRGGTVHSDILNLIVLHVNMSRQINRTRDLTRCRVS